MSVKHLYQSHQTTKKKPHTDLEETFIVKTSNLELMQSVLDRQQQATDLIASLQKLSEKLRSFLSLVEQSELPIMQSTTLLNKVETKTTAIESTLSSILTEIGNLNPQDLKEEKGHAFFFR